jgi:transcriptional regulator with XRE-family HTH domain
VKFAFLGDKMGYSGDTDAGGLIGHQPGKNPRNRFEFNIMALNTTKNKPPYSAYMSRSRNKPPDPTDKRPELIGKRLQNIRKKRGLTQKGLADKVGLTREAIASYESGRARLTDITLLDLATALRTTADEILGLKPLPRSDASISRRLMKRMAIIEGLPEGAKKRVLRTLDDSLRANSRPTILDE